MGSFKILERIGPVAYKLELLPHSKIHPVFHVSLLEPFQSVGRYQPPPPPISLDDALEYEVDRILNHRTVKRGKKSALEYQVTWKGYGVEHDSWEPESNLANAEGFIADYWQSVSAPPSGTTASANNTPKRKRTVVKVGGTRKRHRTR